MSGSALRSVRASFVVATLCIASGMQPALAVAQQVFNGDPVAPGSGEPYVLMPGVALIQPGEDEEFGTGDDTINTSITGDVDLVARFGIVAGPVIPAPGSGSLPSVVAGGGSTGQGAEAAFTILVSDGTGSPPYGSVLTSADMNLRPIAIYSFADIDGDGVVGPTNADGSADNELERQEALAHVGRQTGTFDAGRFTNSLGFQIGAPASIGGVVVSLVAGAFTGDDPEEIFTNGPMLLTRWPFFPPIDPKRLLGGGDAPAPDPDLPSEIEFEVEKIWLPAPGHPQLETPFAVAVDGSEPTTDQIVVVSGPARAARLFAPVTAAQLRARGRSAVRVAPAVSGAGRQIVMAADRVVIAADGAASNVTLRLLPADLLGNVADLASTQVVTLIADGNVALTSPNTDSDSSGETLALEDAAGVEVTLDDFGGAGAGTIEVFLDGKLVHTTVVGVGAGYDYDGDAVDDDGSASGLGGDKACEASAASCDDNCPRTINPTQIDSDGDGAGDCCDGTCIDDPLGPACGECASPVIPEPSTSELTDARVSAKLLSPLKPDVFVMKIAFTLETGAVLVPDGETVSISLLQGPDGYTAELPGLFENLGRPRPVYSYADSSAAVDGVLKAQIKNTRAGAWKMFLRASGFDLVALMSGSAQLEIAIGDDIFLATLDCRSSGTRVRCSF